MDIQEIVAGIGAGDGLREAADKAGISADQAQTALQSVLEHVSQSAPLESLVEQVAAKAGVEPAQVQQFLPSVMQLLQGHAENASEGVQQTLTGILGSLGHSAVTGVLSKLDANQDGSVIDDALGAVKGLLGRRD